MQAIEISQKITLIPEHQIIRHPEYPIHVGLGIVAHVGQLLQSVGDYERVFVIADENAMRVHGAKLFSGLSDCCHIRAMVLPTGESHKTLATTQQIIDFLISEKAQRGDLMVAFGGGVTGDMAGFAASIYMRGMSYIHVPTTLLAQVDSSIGGKVGVNLPEGKNLMGSFHNPKMVIVDPELLSSLPVQEWQNGVSELVKYGFTLEPKLLDMLPETIEPSQAIQWKEAILKAIELKVGVTTRDPKENGERRVLNFGHTLGHGLEKLEGYGQISHGRAVAMGMIGETRFLEQEGLQSTSLEKGVKRSDKLTQVLDSYGLGKLEEKRAGQLLARHSLQDWQQVLGSDKKAHAKGVTLICPSDKGDWQSLTTPIAKLAAFAAQPKVELQPKSLTGTVQIPSSKSMGHRSLIGAALAEGVSEIHRLQPSADIQATLLAIKVLGAEVTESGACIKVKGAVGTGNRGAAMNFPCGESGSTLRFMIPIGMLWSGEKVFEGTGRLPERPLTEYLTNFDRLGLRYQYGGKLPLKTSDQLKAGHYCLKGNESSQYLTGLLMALPLLTEDSVIEVIGELESRDYVTLTLEVLKAHGISIQTDDLQHYRIPGNQRYLAAQHTVEGDYSQAAFWVVAGLLGQAPLKCSGLRPESSQADKRLLEIVQQMGGKIGFEGETLCVMPSRTTGTRIDASQCPDLIPALAVLASVSQGETQIVNGQRLRIKESDRIKSTVAMLKSLGGQVVETDDGMIIQGVVHLNGGEVDSCNDHRIVMATAAASVKCQNPVTILGAAAVNKSYPKFFEDFASLGGVCHGTL